MTDTSVSKKKEGSEHCSRCGRDVMTVTLDKKTGEWICENCFWEAMKK